MLGSTVVLLLVLFCSSKLKPKYFCLCVSSVIYLWSSLWFGASYKYQIVFLVCLSVETFFAFLAVTCREGARKIVIDGDKGEAGPKNIIFSLMSFLNSPKCFFKILISVFLVMYFFLIISRHFYWSLISNHS